MLAELNGSLYQIDTSDKEDDQDLGLLHTELIIVINFIKLLHNGEAHLPKEFLEKVSKATGKEVVDSKESLNRAEADIYDRLPPELRTDMNRMFHNTRRNLTTQNFNR